MKCFSKEASTTKNSKRGILKICPEINTNGTNKGMQSALSHAHSMQFDTISIITMGSVKTFKYGSSS